MSAKLRKAINAYDEAINAARKQIDNAWLDRRLADMTTPDSRPAEYDRARLTLAAQYGIPSNMA